MGRLIYDAQSGLMVPKAEKPEHLKGRLLSGAPFQALLMSGAASGGDPLFSQVVRLWHMDTVPGGITPDSSPYGGNLTKTGSTNSISGTNPKFGAGSYFNNGTVQFLSASGATELTNLATGNFAVEGWINPSALGAIQAIFTLGAGGNGPFTLQLLMDSSNKAWFRCYDAAGPSIIVNLTGTTTLGTGTWYFLQAIRSGGNFLLGVNGVQEASVAISSGTALFNTLVSPIIGTTTGGSVPNNGFIDEVRITGSGTARTINLPTAAFPNF